MIHTHSLKAYAASKHVSLIQALHQLWIITNERVPTTSMEIIGILSDLEVWRRTNELPKYAKVALEHERVRQIEPFARVGPQGFASFP